MATWQRADDGNTSAFGGKWVVMTELVLDFYWGRIQGRKVDHLWLCLASINAADYILIVSGCGSQRVPKSFTLSGRRCPNCVGVADMWLRSAIESGSQVEYDTGEYGSSMTIHPEDSLAESVAAMWERAWRESCRILITNELEKLWVHPQ